MGCNFLSSKKIQAGEDSRYMKDSPIVLPVDACSQLEANPCFGGRNARTIARVYFRKDFHTFA
jgi:hypothetical protein